MQVISTIEECRDAVHRARAGGLVCGLVPTMGALHEGHMSLVRAARQRCGWVIVTIFVNPTQFGPSEDFAAYPRTMDEDLAKCRAVGVEAAFAPSVETMYGGEPKTTVHVAGLTDGLCGPHRPGHFDGVATVVAKLFQIAPTQQAFFGEKDYQQLMVIRKMVADLNMDIEIVACPTLREPDGLAMSSRNVYLSAADRAKAVSISRALFAAREAVKAGKKNAFEIQGNARETILDAGISAIDYVTVVDATSLEPLIKLDRPARLCVAARVGRTRLIDNIAL